MEPTWTLGVGFVGGAGGLAFGGAIALGMDSDQTSAQIADSTTNASGNTSVEAGSSETLTTTAIAGAEGSLALNLALTIIDLSGSTTAAISDSSVTSGGTVDVMADDTPSITDHIGSGGMGSFAAGAGIEIVTITNALAADISSGSVVDAGGDVDVTATGDASINSVIISFSLSGIASVNGAISLISVGMGLDSQGASQVNGLTNDVNNDISSSGGLGLSNQFGPTGQAQSSMSNRPNVTGVLTPAPAAAGSVDTDAFIGNGAVVHAGGNLNLTATDSVSANPLVGQASASGFVSVGASVSIVDIANVTDASIGSGAAVDASNSGPGNLSVGASFTDNVTPQVYAGTAGGDAALGAQVAIINDTSSQSATIGSGATIARANSVNIVATADRTLNAQALGGTASLLVAAGAAIAQASVTGDTMAALGSQANVGGGDVGSVTVNASANDVVTTSAFAVAAGILAGNGADATASVTPSVAASIGSGSTIDLTGDASVLATSTTSALATTTGVNVQQRLGFSDPSSLRRLGLDGSGPAPDDHRVGGLGHCPGRRRPDAPRPLR